MFHQLQWLSSTILALFRNLYFWTLHWLDFSALRRRDPFFKSGNFYNKKWRLWKLKHGLYYRRTLIIVGKMWKETEACWGRAWTDDFLKQSNRVVNNLISNWRLKKWAWILNLDFIHKKGREREREVQVFFRKKKFQNRSSSEKKR